MKHYAVTRFRAEPNEPKGPAWKWNIRVCVCVQYNEILRKRNTKHTRRESEWEGETERERHARSESKLTNEYQCMTRVVCACVCTYAVKYLHTHTQKEAVAVGSTARRRRVVVGCPEVSRTVVGHRQQSTSSGGVASSAAATAVVASVATRTYTPTLIHCHRTCEQRLHLFFCCCYCWARIQSESNTNWNSQTVCQLSFYSFCSSATVFIVSRRQCRRIAPPIAYSIAYPTIRLQIYTCHSLVHPYHRTNYMKSLFEVSFFVVLLLVLSVVKSCVKLWQ